MTPPTTDEVVSDLGVLRHVAVDAEVEVGVDAAGQHDLARGVDELVGVGVSIRSSSAAIRPSRMPMSILICPTYGITTRPSLTTVSKRAMCLFLLELCHGGEKGADRRLAVEREDHVLNLAQRGVVEQAAGVVGELERELAV